MKQKSLFWIIILCFITISLNVYASDDVNWKNDKNLNLTAIDVREEHSYLKGQDVLNGNLQGMTITDRYFVMAIAKDNNSASSLYFIDKNTFKIADVITRYAFTNVSDLAYNKYRDEVIVPYFNYTDNKSHIALIDGSKKKLKTDVSIDKQYYTLTFNDKDRNYLAVADELTIYNLGTDYNEISNYFLPINYLTHNGIAYYNNHIYFANYEAGNATDKQVTQYNSSEAGSNLIYVYSNQGELEKTFYLSDMKLADEIKSVAFTSEGEMFLAYDKTNGSIGIAKIIYKSADISYHLNLSSKTEVEDGTYNFSLVDNNGNIIQNKYNIGNKIVFDSIVNDGLNAFKYKIVNNQNGEEYSVVTRILGDPFNLRYVSNTSYDNIKTLLVELDKSDPFVALPNKISGKVVAIEYGGLLIIVMLAGLLLLKKMSSKRN